jgi:hypothetical protein
VQLLFNDPIEGSYKSVKTSDGLLQSFANVVDSVLILESEKECQHHNLRASR